MTKDNIPNFANIGTDDFDPIFRGFVSALRNKEYFFHLKDIFDHMNKISLEVQPGSKSDTYFLDNVFETKSLGQVWIAISALMDRGYAPIKELSLLSEVEKDSTDHEIEEGEEDKEAPKKSHSFLRELREHKQLLSRLKVLFPPPNSIPPDVEAFANYFATRPVDACEADYKACLAFLEVTSVSAGSLDTKKLVDLQKKDPREALTHKEERIRKIRTLFTKGSSQFVSSSSTIIKELLTPKPGEKARLPFYAGTSDMSMDAQLGGFHSKGLICFIGGTSGFKSGVKSSLVANHVLQAFLDKRKPASVWGYIGEDGVESYTQRIITNIMNRAPFLQDFNFEEFTIGYFQEMMADTEFQETAFLIADQLLSNCFWLRPPVETKDKLKFSTLNILQAFEAKLDEGSDKPDFIVIDYLNLLTLPREYGQANRAQEVSEIAHLLDEWSQLHGIPIITSVQSSVDGAVAARDMRFYNQEDIHECKSVQHHCRMMVSILPYTDYTDAENPQRTMAFKILKNRNGQKGQIFVSDLNEGANITMTESKYFTEAEWTNHVGNIMTRMKEVFGQALGTKVLKPGYGTGRGKGAQSSTPQTASSSYSNANDKPDQGTI